MPRPKINRKREPVALIGHFSAELGVGEAGRRLSLLLTALGLETKLIDFRGSKSRKLDKSVKTQEHLDSRGYLISCVNADQIAYTNCLYRIPANSTTSHIGFWSWELEHFPKGFKPATHLVDEIWTVSEFSRQAIGRLAETPVRAIKLPVPIPELRKGLRDHFKFRTNDRIALVNFDFSSDVERKNILNTLTAYKLAFPNEADSKLVIKSINYSSKNPEHLKIWEQCISRKDIIWMPNYLSRSEMSELMSIADVYLSLHRSEGYGINLADAMARSVPVIATGYSGNLDFMNDSCSVLIDYKLVRVSSYGGFMVDSVWAEPDLEQAAGQLRRFLGNNELAKRVGRAGLENIRRNHSLSAAVEDIRKTDLNA